MARAPWAEEHLYDVAKRWVGDCLRNDGSLFTPDRSIWSSDVVTEAAPRLLHEDIRKLDYMTKLRDQLEGISDDGLQFTSELLYVHSLPIVNTGEEAKRALIEAPLEWMSERVALPADLIEPLRTGVANFGAGLAQRDRYVKYFVRFVQAWKERGSGDRERLLAQPSSFREFVHSLGGPPLMQREALLHLVDPETFEYALAPSDKAKIAKAFARIPSVRPASNDDEALAAVRSEVEDAIERPLNLYAPWFAGIWRERESDQWAAALRWAELVLAAPEFDADERDYKLVVAERMRAAREAVANRDEWLTALRSAFERPNNMTHWQYEHGPFLSWCDEEPEAARRFLDRLWANDTPTQQDLNEALAELPFNVLGSPAARLTLTSVLLFATDVTRFPPYRARAVMKFLRLVGADLGEEFPPFAEEGATPEQLAAALGVDGKRVRDFLRAEFPRAAAEKGSAWRLSEEQASVVVARFTNAEAADLGDRYVAFLTSLDELRIRMMARGVTMRDRLDAQGVMWWLATSPPAGSWSDQEKAEFLAWQQGERIGPPPPPGPSKAAVPSVAAEVAERLHLPLRWVQDAVDLLNQKQQVIFYGPPGTGKTYVAQALGEHVEASGGTWRLVQFHPAYSYEDFFEGYRPLQHEEGGALQFRLRHGPLREMVEVARGARDVPHLLVIDEINRGNLPKIFGELYFLLEYRNRSVRLQYSPDDAFSLPENLYFIGTMNTADRSIALVDSALRRRFYFVPFLPREAPIAGVLASWLAANGFDEEPARLLDELNSTLSERDGGGDEFAIGPSYFMPKDGEPDVELVWKHAILPLLEERFYGTMGRDQVEKEFGLVAMQARLRRGGGDAELEPAPDETDEPAPADE
jgi:5-methylcytosine-specific restriction protein B